MCPGVFNVVFARDLENLLYCTGKHQKAEYRNPRYTLDSLPDIPRKKNGRRRVLLCTGMCGAKLEVWEKCAEEAKRARAIAVSTISVVWCAFYLLRTVVYAPLSIYRTGKRRLLLTTHLATSLSIAYEIAQFN